MSSTHKICICVDHSFEPPQFFLHTPASVGKFFKESRGYSVFVTEITQDTFYIDWDTEAGDEFPTIHYEFQGTPCEQVVRYLPDQDRFLFGDAEDYQELGESALHD